MTCADSSGSYVGVILAAGMGARLRPMTNALPKCLVKTAGKPILQYQIDAYRKAGIKELIIVVGYEGQTIRNYSKHIKDMRITIVENADYEITNNMYSFYLTKDHIGDRPFILNNADLAVAEDIVSIMLGAAARSAVAIDSSQFNEESMKVVVNESGFICDIAKSIPVEESCGCSIDYYKFSREDGQAFIGEVTKIIEVEKNLKDWTEVALQRAFKRQALKFSAIDIVGFDWVEIDNYDDLAISDRKFSDFDRRLADIRTIFMDLDGTVHLGGKVLPGAPEAIDRLRKAGKKVYFLSNNSSQSKTDSVRKLQDLSVAATEDDIVLSTDAVIEYLKESGIEKVYILGTTSMKKAFLDAGFRIEDSDPDYVVVGYDTELDYKKLKAACTYINKGVDIIATHCDAFCPSENGPIPDIGAMIELIRVTTGKSPVKIFGKPDREMVQPILASLAVEPGQVLFVGDRLHTDILMATNVGAQSVLVLTGETSRDMVQHSTIQPTFVLRSIAEMLR